VLAEFVQAGHLACQLEAFVSFFLDEDQRDSAFLFQKHSLEKKSSRTMRRKRKRQNFRSNVELQPKYETIQGNQPVDGGGTSPHCLVNQAFAGAVRTIMQGKLASLNTLGASVVHRRQNTVSGWAGGEFVQVSEDTDPGLIFGFGLGDITLLELYLHTSRLREQFQALAAVCMIDGGIYSTGKYDNRADPEHATERRHGDEGALPPAAGNQCITVGCAPKPFPRGADLLTYLYEKLSESDPISLELLRFLFERACRPYAGFIQLWLYHATVEDPFEEFIVKCAEGNGMPLSPPSTASGLVSKQTSMSTFQVRTGVSVPSFLEAVCTPLLRAGQQLQVLSKLLETHQFAPHVANFPLLPTGGSQHLSSCSSTIGSKFLNDESSVLTPILHFSKLKLQHVVQQREIRRQVMMERYDRLFADLAQSCLPGEQGEKDRLWQIVQFPSVPKNKLSQKISDKTEQSIDMLLDRPLKSKLKMDARILASAASRVEKRADEDVQAGITQENSDIICVSVETPRTSSAPQHTENKKTLVLSIGFHDKLSHCSYPDARASLISDFRRGTSWPLCGLPSNPFLPSNKTHTSTHAYTHTVFHDKDRHWDIAMHWGDPMRFFPSERSLFDGMEGFVEDKSGPISCHGVAAVRPDWFTRLEESFHYQLFRGLDAQILQEQFGNLGFESDREDVGDHNPYGTMSKDWANYMSPGSLTPLLERNSWRHLQPNPEWEEVVESAAVDAYGNCYFVEECVSPKGENIKLMNPHDETDSLGGLGVISTSGKSVDPSLFGLLQSGRDSCGKSCETIAESLDTLSAPKEIMPSEDSKLLDSMDNHHKTTKSSAETDTIASSESMGAASAGSGGSGRGASWQTYLGAGSREHVRQLPEMQYEAAAACEDGDDSDEEIPLVVVVDQCLVQEILSQYQLVSMFTVRLFQEGLCLQNHYAALRRYYFMERGDWAEYFLTALCKHEWGHTGGQPRLLEVQAMLETALQSSSCEGDEYAERLYVVIHDAFEANPSSLHKSHPQFSHRSRVPGPFVSRNCLGAFDCFKLGYKVDWPIGLILTPTALSLYSEVFTFLMRTKLTVYGLEDTWQYLQVIGRSLDKSRKASDYVQQKKRFRMLQLFRQQIGHVVTTVQYYVESQLHHVVWGRFVDSVQQQVKDIHDLEQVHSAYIEDCCHQCFLSRDMNGVKACIDTIMQCTLDFRAHLSTASQEGDSNSSNLINDNLFVKVLDVKYTFEASLRKLYAFHRRPEPQYRILLSEFWMCLDFNGFVAHTCSQAPPS